MAKHADLHASKRYDAGIERIIAMKTFISGERLRRSFAVLPRIISDFVAKVGSGGWGRARPARKGLIGPVDLDMSIA